MAVKNVFTKFIASFIFVYIDLTIGFFLPDGLCMQQALPIKC